MKQAQRYPEDFDGILSVVPGISWSKFLIANVYP
ncbi:tannase/feruloyl esterase family alpha/beta hydrolase [Rhizobium mongolense]|nr:tannase/feruloyl esterase family alpha/beta hydrolase [Rhizobium mongolense]